jgi:CubicO group peptidase (beta-lactamase class C family)
MRPQTKWQILALGLMIAFPLTTFAADKDVRAKELDAILSKAVAPGQPGMAVLVKKAGTVLFEKGYGVTKLKGSHRSRRKRIFALRRSPNNSQQWQ